MIQEYKIMAPWRALRTKIKAIGAICYKTGVGFHGYIADNEENTHQPYYHGCMNHICYRMWM
jgi:hypothetical protein